jgi:hypothetical protein
VVFSTADYNQKVAAFLQPTEAYRIWRRTPLSLWSSGLFFSWRGMPTTFESSDVLRAPLSVRALLATSFHSGLLLGLLFDPEDGRDMCLLIYILMYVMQNVWKFRFN